MTTSLLVLGSKVIVDVAIVVLVVEGIIYSVMPFSENRKVVISAVANGLAGLCLLLALRAALHDAAQVWVVAGLAGAAIAHLIDLTFRRRLESKSLNLVAEQHGQQ